MLQELLVKAGFSDDYFKNYLEEFEAKGQECDCPCHKDGVPPHDHMLCPQCGEWLKSAPSRLDLYHKQMHQSPLGDDL